MNKLIFSLLILLGGSWAQAAKVSSSSIEDIRYVPSGDTNEVVISYSGAATMDLIRRPDSKQVILVITGKDFPAGLARRIDTSSLPGPVMEISPYNSGGEIVSSKVVIQLREPCNVVEEKLSGQYKLVFSKPNSGTIAGVNGKEKYRPWSGRRPGMARNRGDRLAVRSAAPDRSLEAAEDLIHTLDSPVESRIYKGAKVSIETDEVNVHDVFRLVGAASGLNILTTVDVSGTVSLSLKDVPWDQLLDIVLQEKQLKATNTGNVIRITTIANYNKEQDAKLQMQVVEKRIEPVMMAIIPVNYAKAPEIKAAISKLLVGSIDESAGLSASSAPVAAAPASSASSQRSLITTAQSLSGTPVGSSSSGSAASSSSSGSSVSLNTARSAEEAVQAFSRGKIEVDPRTNSLLVTHTAEQIKRIRALVRELDVPTPQVLIESKVVSANDTFSKSLGVDWGGFYQAGPPGGVDANAGGVGFASNTFSGAQQFSISNDSTNGVGSGAFGFRLGQGANAHLDMKISIAEQDSQAKVMASPRVITNNNVGASISDGTLISYTTTTNTSSGSQSNTAFIEASLSLRVTPQVTNSGQVALDLSVEQGLPVAGSGSTPNISRKNITTNVLVQSGSTLVLGGVYSYNFTKGNSGIPWLKDLPLLGTLFRKETASTGRSELLIFVTPRIIEASVQEDKESFDEGITL